MLCNFCNIARLDNEAPCPNCGAPSPLLNRTNGAFGASQMAGTMSLMQPMAPMSTTDQLGNPFASQPVPMNNAEVAFLPQTPQQFPSQPLQPLPMSPASPPSLLPVPYQGGVTNQQGQIGFGSALVPLQDMDTSAMFAPLPLNEDAVFVPPMYTKPRAIIPRYRAISGLISLLIVTLLACGTIGYYAKSSSQFAFLRQLYGSTLPANEKPAPAPVLPDPKKIPDYGPAAKVITSATTNTRIDPQNFVSAQPSQFFHPGQTIWLTYSVQPPKKGSGTLTIEWYTNGRPYLPGPPKVVTDDPKISGYVVDAYTTQEFAQPVEGKVELDWNNQMGITLYFVVR